MAGEEWIGRNSLVNFRAKIIPRNWLLARAKAARAGGGHAQVFASLMFRERLKEECDWKRGSTRTPDRGWGAAQPQHAKPSHARMLVPGWNAGFIRQKGKPPAPVWLPDKSGVPGMVSSRSPAAADASHTAALLTLTSYRTPERICF
jgi:hypothetical protein